jgi:oligopeptide/dipeptide ABC transporter ATP-binding protein
VIIADEAVAALDVSIRAQVVNLLMDLQARLGVAFLFISHDMAVVERVAHRVAVMYLGQIVEAGTVEQVFARPRHPYARALLSAHLTPDPAHRRVDRRNDEQLQGEIPSPIDLPAGCYLASRCPHVLPRCQREPQNLEPLADGRAVRCWRVAAGELAEADA